MENALNILIGAGFSYYAGLPLGNDIKNKFDRDLREQLLRASGSEWSWKEGKDEVTIHNGSLGTYPLTYSYILNEVVVAYKKERGNFDDYEDFYQFVKDKSGNLGWYAPLFQNAKSKMYSEHNIEEPNEYYDILFTQPQIGLIEDIINYLISDMLWSSKSDEELLTAYSEFINYIVKYDEINIFTLNHDMLLERLLRIAGLSYCEGFKTENSILKYQNASIPIFQGEFESASIKIYKLHGSIDTYLFEHGAETNSVLTRNGEYTYFKPISYQSKHYLERIDLLTGNTVQRFSSDTVIPRFITGKDKKAFIESDYMYSKLYKIYKEKIHSVKNLLIIGYSYRDEHVNEEFLEFTKEDGANIININYSDIFKFEAPSVIEIKNFTDLLLIGN